MMIESDNQDEGFDSITEILASILPPAYRPPETFVMSQKSSRCVDLSSTANAGHQGPQFSTGSNPFKSGHQSWWNKQRGWRGPHLYCLFQVEGAVLGPGPEKTSTGVLNNSGLTPRF